ncbi:vitamin K epoxide reductase family protein [Yimella sp. RIT 621]|nr:vitamin K epoxide reductase family protein [Yimella sp. RIT 621]
MMLSRTDPAAGVSTETGADPGGRHAPGRSTAWSLLVAGLIGLVASATLLIEKVELLKDPGYTPTCSINPVLSCGSIMKTWQAELLGFPNPVIGVVGFAVVTTTGASLLAGAVLRGWYWWGLLIGAAAGVLLVHWLILQSLYRIGALCPYCMVVWVVTMTIFVAAVTSLRRALRVPPSIIQYAPSLLVAWTLVVAALIAVRFWDYWSTLV